MELKGILLWAALAVVCAAIALYSHRMKKKIEEEGTETTGVVCRITDTGGAGEIDLQYYVRYRTQDGEEIEALLSNPRADLEEGEQVRIKVHPKYKSNARLVSG